MSTVWGVDTASVVKITFLDCIKNKYGSPAFIGRYLQTVPKRSAGLSTAEAAFIHKQGIKIWVLDNTFGIGTSGGTNGYNAAKAAIEFAQGQLFIPSGTRIFADIEEKYDVDAARL
ncbi:MAG: glycoside hydrolase domain-containing protein [Bacilli bacterium]